MKDLNIVFAGFGGQGILFAGKVVAYAGLIEGRELSWLPSYGPEMRGGTANCSICLSDEPIGSPLVTNPNVLIAMNRPSLDKFVNEVEPGGTILLDSSLIDERVERDDVTVFYVPASKLAEALRTSSWSVSCARSLHSARKKRSIKRCKSAFPQEKRICSVSIEKPWRSAKRSKIEFI